MQLDINTTKDVFIAFRRPANNPNATVLSVVPPLDKVEEIQDSVKNKNYAKALGIGILLINSFKKDISDIKEVKNDIKNIIETGKFRYEDHQIPHYFTLGTKMEKYPLFDTLIKIDKTFGETRVGNFILTKIGKKDYHDNPTGLFNKFNEPIYKTKFLGNKIAEITGRMFLRIPMLGVITMGILEIPSIIKEKAHKKQVIKATISISSIILSSATLGALCAYYPPLGFFGAGIGALLGSKVAEKINKKF